MRAQTVKLQLPRAANVSTFMRNDGVLSTDYLVLSALSTHSLKHCRSGAPQTLKMGNCRQYTSATVGLQGKRKFRTLHKYHTLIHDTYILTLVHAFRYRTDDQSFSKCYGYYPYEYFAWFLLV